MQYDIERLPKELREIVMDTNAVFNKEGTDCIDEVVFELFKSLVNGKTIPLIIPYDKDC